MVSSIYTYKMESYELIDNLHVEEQKIPDVDYQGFGINFHTILQRLQTLQSLQLFSYLFIEARSDYCKQVQCDQFFQVMINGTRRQF